MPDRSMPGLSWPVGWTKFGLVLALFSGGRSSRPFLAAGLDIWLGAFLFAIVLHDCAVAFFSATFAGALNLEPSPDGLFVAQSVPLYFTS